MSDPTGPVGAPSCAAAGAAGTGTGAGAPLAPSVEEDEEEDEEDIAAPAVEDRLGSFFFLIPT